jgi:ornithine carbamoyltransferase
MKKFVLDNHSRRDDNMENLLNTESISQEVLKIIFENADCEIPLDSCGTVACSFQGAGTRTRTSFIQALDQLELNYVDLPVFLDTKERLQDLAGYLDQYYDLYIIRYSDHDKLAEFADYSQRPVINAMSSFEHPCEAIADAYWFNTKIRPLNGARVVVWGPTTNVLRSWYNVASIAGAEVLAITRADDLPCSIDIVITDGWPRIESDVSPIGLELGYLEEMGNPVLLPTPPFTIGKELSFDPLTYSKFSGYAQKACLLDVQKAIIRHVLQNNRQQDTAPDSYFAALNKNR